MTDPSGYGSGKRLTFHGPLSAERANRLAADLAATGPATVVDYGCGWGELLLRVLAAAPQATGVGIDIQGADLARARESAEKRDLSNVAARPLRRDGLRLPHPGRSAHLIPTGFPQGVPGKFSLGA